MPDTQTITAQVDSLRFQNKNTGWTIANLYTDDGPETAVGVMPGLKPGMDITAQVERVTHPQYGAQLKVHAYTTSAPTSTEGLVIFLQEMVYGIGPVMAERIVERFGSRTPEYMSQPAALAAVPGIGAQRAAAIAKSWGEHETERAALEGILTFLVTHGLPTGLARKIFDAFKFEAPEKLRQDPYQLTAIAGVGFKRADAIAQALGFTTTCPERLRAALVYQSDQETRNGHCYTPRAELLATTHATLTPEAAPLDLAGSLTVLLNQENPPLVADAERVYPWKLYRAERDLAARVATLCAAPSHLDIPDPTPAPSATITYTEQQQAAIAAALTQRVSIITGGPGTGKTTLVNAIVSATVAHKGAVLLVSPTGKAAKRLSEVTGQEASTIHRALGTLPNSRRFAHDKHNPLDADMVICDEASMLDVRLARSLLDAVRPGAHLVLVGDVDQLPSVGPGNVLRDLIAAAETRPELHVTRLSVIHRQAADSGIITNAHLINAGEMPAFSKKAAGDFYLFPAADAEAAAAWVVDLVAERIPTKFGITPEDIQVLTPMHRGAAGDHALNQALQERLNPLGQRQELASFDRRFRAGDRVIQTRNDYDRGVFNGDQGRVVRIGEDPENHDKPTAWLEFDGQLHACTQPDLADVNLAYALTVHKSQGSEFLCVVHVALTQHYVMLQRNLLYTAVTRARKLVVTVGNQRALGIALANDRVRARNTHLGQRVMAALDVTNDTHGNRAVGLY